MRWKIWVALTAGIFAIGSLLFLPIAGAIQVATFQAPPPSQKAAKQETVSYISVNGKIAATLLTPLGEPSGYVIFAHGYKKEGRHHPLYSQLANALADKYVVLSFDFYGFGESESIKSFPIDGTLDFSADIVAGADYLSRRFSISMESIALVGHSYGGPMVILAGDKLNSERVIAIGIGDFGTSLKSQRTNHQLIEKLTWINIEADRNRLQSLFRPLYAVKLFKACKSGRLTMIWGELDEGLPQALPHVETHNKNCDPPIPSKIIPLANHSFWSEGAWGWKSRALLSLFDSEVWFSMLVREIVDVLESTENSSSKRPGMAP